LPRDPETGKRKQQWLTVRGTKDAAEDELIRRLAELKAGEYVNPTDQTVADSLEYWLENVIRPSKRLRTHETYESIVRVHFRPFFDRLKLADLNFSHLEGYYRKKRKGGLAWCRRRDLNPHTLSGATPSRWCVCHIPPLRHEHYCEPPPGSASSVGGAGVGAGTAGTVSPGADGGAARSIIVVPRSWV
jgi:hypothetical protein